jgi:hypothetical protein
MEKKQVYDLSIVETEKEGFKWALALVDEPAIMVDWQEFSAQKKAYRFEADEKRRILTGPLMIPNLPIPRIDEKTQKEFFVRFDGQTTEKMLKSFMRDGLTKNINLMHDKNLIAEGVYIFEAWMADESRGVKAPEAFKDLPDRTIYGSVHVANEELYNEFIATGKLRGFSIEGLFQQQLVAEETEKDLIDQIKDILK